ncbi:Bacillibactin exporter [Salinivirga cyanobacteriivorans]|uniref:Bacillibactin exporter n=1 Tax=Salinivirga cyanobacteriivorans TaxID=1307839 RepID=A0A0S2HYW1_9BACT|nr:Bacillibactin exporter [Salinivirga cyanobacteriivorans]
MPAKNNKQNIIIIFSITLLAVMGVASLTPAFPTIARHFNLNMDEIGLLITAFTIPGIFMAPLMGILADRLGRKAVLIPSLILFGLAGAACAHTNNFNTLLILRVFQGLGAASLGSLNITIIGDLFEGNRRTTIMGYNASVLSIGTAFYPAIGGALALINWKFIFYLPLLAIPIAMWALTTLPTPRPENGQNVKNYFYSLWKIVNQPYVWALFSMNIFVFIILYGAYLTFLPSFLETKFQADSFEIGIIMSIMSITTAITATQLGKISKRFNKRLILTLSSIAYILALALLALSTNITMVIMAVIIYGFGQGLFIPTIQTLLAGIASVRERASIMSINSMVLRIGQSMGPVVMALFYIEEKFFFVFMAASAIALGILIINNIFMRFNTK